VRSRPLLGVKFVCAAMQGGKTPTVEASCYKLYAPNCRCASPTPRWTSSARVRSWRWAPGRAARRAPESCYTYTVIDTIGGGSSEVQKNIISKRASRPAEELLSGRAAMSFLQGYKVLDLASVGPAARASRILADYGMEIIKVAPVSAKGGKQTEPVYHAYGAGRGTRASASISQSAEGKAVVHRLVRNVDVLIESYRPGVAQAHRRRLRGAQGSTIRAWSTARPAATGRTVPARSGPDTTSTTLRWAAFSPAAAAMPTGVRRCPAPRWRTAPVAACRQRWPMMAALVNRLRRDEGAYLDVAITDGVLNLTSLYIDEYLATGVGTGPETTLLTGKFACYGIYATRDGKAIAVGAIETHFFANLCRLLGLEQYAPLQYDASRQEEIKAAMRAVFLTRDRDEWTALLAGENTCATPVLDIPELTRSEHFAARNTFMQAHHPVHGSFRQLGPILAGNPRDLPTHQVAAPGTTDTDGVLAAAGFDTAEIARLRDTGVVE
jgi:alpha-methylacyl-CoA racemase